MQLKQTGIPLDQQWDYLIKAVEQLAKALRDKKYSGRTVKIKFEPYGGNTAWFNWVFGGGLGNDSPRIRVFIGDCLKMVVRLPHANSFTHRIPADARWLYVITGSKEDMDALPEIDKDELKRMAPMVVDLEPVVDLEELRWHLGFFDTTGFPD